YQPKNLKALKPGVQTTDAPADRLDRTAAISPWIWNSGMTLRQVSPGVSDKVAAMFCAEAATLIWRSGTIFGRAVVPEVCSTSAISSDSAEPGTAALPARFVGEASIKSPAASP